MCRKGESVAEVSLDVRDHIQLGKKPWIDPEMARHATIEIWGD